MTTPKVALLAAALLAGMTMTQAATADLGVGAPQAADAACRMVSTLDMGCALRIVDAGSDGVLPLVDTAATGPAPVVADWADPRTGPAPGDFKDAAIAPASILPATLERDRTQPLIPALMALAAMVILLRRRPISF
ncbi:MAG: hypothetical protein ABJD97_14935 [Betaproteobacteria bacterium]